MMFKLQDIYCRMNPFRVSTSRFTASDAETGSHAMNTRELGQGSMERKLTPRAGQPVFEQAPVIKITQSRRIAITAFLVVANLVQVRHSTLPSSYMNAKGK